MNIISRTVLKKYEYAQVNLIKDANGKKFIEKIQFHLPPVIPLTFQYDYSELEIIESIIKPLEIPHARIVDSIQNEECTTYIMDFIEGINCVDEPKAEYLYLAAEKIGTVYRKSIMNINRVNRDMIEKYTLTEEKMSDYIKVIKKYYDMPSIESMNNYIFEKYRNRPTFVNHGDVQFKNFIYNDDLHLIDWSGQITPFFSDLGALIGQAQRVNADAEEIKKRYLKFSQIGYVTDEDLLVAGIVGSVVGLFNLLIFDCPTEWIENSYHELMNLIPLLDINKHYQKYQSSMRSELQDI